MTDPKVRKKVLAVLASWSRQFKDDRSAAGIAGLYRQVKPSGSEGNREALLAERERESEKRRKEKEEAKRKVKEKRLEEARSKKAASRTATSRKQFNFEQVCVFFFQNPWCMPFSVLCSDIAS
jgi:hypothetical protein